MKALALEVLAAAKSRAGLILIAASALLGAILA